MIVLAIDPGLAKCGLAVVSGDGILHRSVVPRSEVVNTVTGLISHHHPTDVIVGMGTSGRKLADDLKTVGLDPALVDERNTSLDARKRYFLEHPPKRLLKLVPRGLLLPKVPVDDYVAVILAERYIEHSLPQG